jgi:hypothetical protein
MPFYSALDSTKPADRRTANGLLRLKDALDEEIPPRTPTTMLLASWNIREFESGKYGPRPPEPIYYMAEIIDRFDVVAVQEVRDDLSSFNQLMDLLGSNWWFLFTDVTEGKAGNRERMAFLYNSRTVRFAGLAGEVVLPPNSSAARVQLVRSPYIVGLKSGWLSFALCTTHILYGENKAELPARVREIQALVKFLGERAQSTYPDARNIILLGDFNVYATTDKTLEAIRTKGFVVPDGVLEQTSNVTRNKHYDQIAIRGEDLGEATAKGLPAGAFHFFDYVYRDPDESEYVSAMGAQYHKKKTGEPRTQAERTTYYRGWRTFQMSDHMPLWVEIPKDHSRAYLKKKAILAPSAPRRAATQERAMRQQSGAKAIVAGAPPLVPPERQD